jgi:hypothetical protein
LFFGCHRQPKIGWEIESRAAALTLGNTRAETFLALSTGRYGSIDTAIREIKLKTKYRYIAIYREKFSVFQSREAPTKVP